MLAKKDAAKRFGGVQALVVDEWHDLLGNKRGVQMELAAAALKSMLRHEDLGDFCHDWQPRREAMDVLMGQRTAKPGKRSSVRNRASGFASRA